MNFNINDLKKIIIVLLIIMVIIITLLFVILLGNKKINIEEPEEPEKVYVEGAEESHIPKQLEKVTSNNEYYTVLDCMQKYVQYIANATTSNSVQDKEILINILDKNYINDNGVSLSNVLNYVTKKADVNTFTIIDIRQYRNERITTYSVYGQIVKNTKQYFIIYIDNFNNTYSIEPLLNKQINNIGQIDISRDIDVIEANNNNKVEWVTLGDVNMCRRYLINYKGKLKNNVDEAYNLLDTEYAKKRFGSLDNFKKYLASIKSDIEAITLDKYESKYYDDYTEYICQDKNGYIYIFKVTAVMEYTVILDTYTIESEEYITKYNELTPEKKCSLNISKIFTALNAKDYKYMYNYLYDAFKNNYFKTEADFEKYAKQKFFEYNEVRVVSAKKENDIYICKCKYKNSKLQNSTEREITIMMRLLDGTNFEMSFDIK